MWVGKENMITEKTTTKNISKGSHDICPCMEECPLSNAIKIIGGKWKLQILCVLKNDGPIRYGQLKQKVHGITNTMLASSLRELESEGLVNRKQYNVMPLRVEYSSTELVDDLLPILIQLGKWAKKVSQSNKTDTSCDML